MEVMFLGGALGGTRLTPEHSIYQHILDSYDREETLKQFNDLLRKYEKYEAGILDKKELFKSIWEIRKAVIMSMDSLLPKSVHRELAIRTDALIDEAIDKKLRIDSFHIEPPKKGRKNDSVILYERICDIKTLQKHGISLSKAFVLVGKKHHKSPLTISREYYRFLEKYN